MHGAKWRGGKPTPIGYTAQRALGLGLGSKRLDFRFGDR